MLTEALTSAWNDEEIFPLCLWAAAAAAHNGKQKPGGILPLRWHIKSPTHLEDRHV